MNTDLNSLHPYPFEKLRALLSNCTGNQDYSPIRLSIGEPKHAAPEFVTSLLQKEVANSVELYPLTSGLPVLRNSIAQWANRRFNLNNALQADGQVLPVNGTREALFAFAQAVVDRTATSPTVVMPNPFYQIYEGAALLAGATPYFVNTRSDDLQIPDFNTVPEQVWKDTQLVYLCTPSNPTGIQMPKAEIRQLIQLADQYDFTIVSDECYLELYLDEQKPCWSLLEVCAEMGRTDFNRCVVFHSLSKRSNLPGLRSGFVAGDAALLTAFLRYRTYHGSAMPIHTQLASAAAWGDESHVKQNRDFYRDKYAAVVPILREKFEVDIPESAFYLWLKTPICDLKFTKRALTEKNIMVVPGSYLSRMTDDGVNPGAGRVRIALVAPIEECIEACQRLCELV